MRSVSLILYALVLFPAGFAIARQTGPVAESPGDVAQIVNIEGECPTFSWDPIEGARGYEIAVYAFDGTDPASIRGKEPFLREKTLGSTSAWRHCLSPGSYAWSVRAEVQGGTTSWSELKLFRIVQKAPAQDTEASSFEVTVTAQKRPENIRDVPISITDVTGDQLEDAGVTNNLELPELVPGLKVDRVGGSTIPAIRGVSSYLTTVGTDANVAMYIDNIYVSSMQAGTLDLPDISSIEVLKGPQGTLYGRNATGGAIRIFTKDPQLRSWGGDFSLSYGNFNDAVIKAFLTGPIIPGKLAASITGYNENADSYYQNLTPEVPLQKIHDDSARVKLLYKPAEDTQIVLSAGAGQHRDPSAILYFPLDGVTVAQGVAGAVIPTQPYQVATNTPIFEETSNDGVSAQFSQHTSVGDFNVLGAQDLAKSEGPVPLVAAAYPAPFTGLQSNVNDRSDAWSGEVNFASRKFSPFAGVTQRSRDRRFSFIAGANYYGKSDKWNPLDVDQNIPGSAYAISIFAGQSTKAYAFYGEGTYQLTDKLSIIGGLRYSSEQRGVTGSEVSGLQATGDYYNWGSRTFDSVTQRVSVLYTVDPKTNVYFTYSTGFKSGNFIATSIPFGVTPAQCSAQNAAAAGTCAFPPVLLPETNTAFEGGVKSEPKSWLQLDAAVFGYKLSNIQIESYNNVCLKNPCPPNPLVQLSGYTNAASATMYGGEFDVNARVASKLFLRAGLSLLNATFSSYENASWFVPAPDNVGMVQTPTTSADGKQLPRAPSATLDLSGTYTKDLDLGVLWFTASAYASARMYYDVGNVFSQPAYATLGLRASFSPARIPKVTASVWGYNVTDTRVILGTILGSTGANVSFAAPATYGATIRYAF
ncbi:MAG TPA: TonB-dependent receptor [Bryobacteraceae bacterium]|jgi:iron complex outermembrane receptor protein|nr:TonB-dependent receptor [Bryobacteraceae bacterium]